MKNFIKKLLIPFLAWPLIASAGETVSSLPTAGSIALSDYLYLVVNGTPYVSKKLPYSVIQQADFAAISGNITINSSGVATIANSSVSNAMLLSNIDAAKIADGSVSNTEFMYLDGVSSNIQTQLNAITGGAITALTGDVTASGPGSVMATLATVNSNTGGWGSSTEIPNFTVSAKGLITAAGQSAVIAPAGTLTGTTLASNVVSSSLTSVGTLANLTVTNPITGSVTGNSATTNALNSASTIVNVSSATAPTSGQVLTATGSTAATWQTLSIGALGYNSGTYGATTISGNNSTSHQVLGFTDNNSAVNSYQIQNSATGDPININAIGTDTNIGMVIQPKGSGGIQLGNLSGSGHVVVQNSITLYDVSSGNSTLLYPSTAAGYSMFFPAVSGDTLVARTSTDTLTNKTINSPIINAVYDSSGNINTKFLGAGSAVNYFQLQSSITGNSPTIQILGSDANIGLKIFTLGTGVLDLPEHITSNIGNGAAPTCGTGCSSITSGASDVRGQLTTGTGVTSILLDFGTTWASAPYCVATENGTGGIALSTSTSTTVLTITSLTALTATGITWVCLQ